MGAPRRVCASGVVVVAALALCACTSAPASDPTPSPSAAPSSAALDVRLRDLPRDGLVVGAAVGVGRLAQDDPSADDEAYRTLIAEQFSSLTPENQLKWSHLRPSREEFAFDDADAIVAFAEANGQQARGHTLLWHKQNPDWVTSGDLSDDELREVLREHVTTVVGRYRGRIAHWDVANEIFDDSGNLRTENPSTWRPSPRSPRSPTRCAADPTGTPLPVQVPGRGPTFRSATPPSVQRNTSHASGTGTRSQVPLGGWGARGGSVRVRVLPRARAACDARSPARARRGAHRGLPHPPAWPGEAPDVRRADAAGRE